MKKAYIDIFWTHRYGRPDAMQIVRVYVDDVFYREERLSATDTDYQVLAGEGQLIRIVVAEPDVAPITWSFKAPRLDPVSLSMSRQMMLSPRETKQTGFVGYRITKVVDEVVVPAPTPAPEPEQEPIYTKSPKNTKIGLDNVDLPE